VTKSQDRVEARRAIQERAIAWRREREQREERIANLAVTVRVALKAGQRALEDAEAEAGEALTQMIATEGITVTEAIEWVGDGKLTAREVGRLRASYRSPSEMPSVQRAPGDERVPAATVTSVAASEQMTKASVT
jgi:hypothetical protein